MGATSDIDHMVNTCLSLAHGKLNQEGKDQFIADAMERVADKVKNVTKQGEKLKASPTVEALFKAHMIFTSDDRLRMLAAILGKREFSAYVHGVAAIQRYRKDVVNNRNTLGHVVLVPEGKPDSVVDDAGKIVDITQMRELRKLILSLRADFRSLTDAMQA